MCRFSGTVSIFGQWLGEGDAGKPLPGISGMLLGTFVPAAVAWLIGRSSTVPGVPPLVPSHGQIPSSR